MMLGRSALAKRLKRRSALASDWLEKNQSELAESSLNGMGPVLNDSTDKELEKSGSLKAEKIPPKKLIETNNVTSLQAETMDVESVENSRLDRNETSGDVSTKQAFKTNKYNSSSLAVSDSIDNNNADPLSTTRDSIDCKRTKKTSSTKSSSDNSSTTTGRNTASEIVNENSTTKRKRSKVVEASQQLEPSFGDDVEGKPTKKRKTCENDHEDMSIEHYQNGEMEESEEVGEADEDEQTQAGGRTLKKR
jgi:hypothetical protein